MRIKRGVATAVAAVLAAVLALGAASASAATEFGDACSANEAEPSPLTLFNISNPANPLPVAAPASGVLTAWRVNVTLGIFPLPFPMTLKQLRSTATSVTVVGESTGALTGATNLIPVRLPIQAGDRLGLSTAAPLGSLTCNGGLVKGEVGLAFGSAVGQTTKFEAVPTEVRVPVVGVVEPDRDGDGYGDETQDGCPQSALFHTPCPVVVLDAYGQAGGKALTVSVATSLATEVSVKGTVKLGKGKTAQLSAKAKTVNPGKLGKFKLQFPRALKQRLKEMPAGKKLIVKVTAAAANLAGKASTDRLSAKLKGQG